MLVWAGLMFQFQNGAIASLFIEIVCAIKISFNSKMVRLQAVSFKYVTY